MTSNSKDGVSSDKIRKIEGGLRGAGGGAASTGFKGLDLGTSHLVLATVKDNREVYQKELHAFVSIPYSKMTKSMLEREKIQHRVQRPNIIAFGNRVDEFANILGGSTRRPMQTGLLNPNEPKNIELVELALRSLCGKAKPGEKICFSVPSPPEGNESMLLFHEESVRNVLEGLGYKVRTINESLAVVIAELQDYDFTGIGISFGGGMCNVCLSYLGLPVVTFATTRAGDYIDESSAAVTGESATTVRLRKEDKDFDLFTDGNPSSIDRAMSIYYREVIQTVALTLERVLNNTKNLPPFKGPIPIVFSGGTSLVGGFQKELRKAIRKTSLPVEISEIIPAESGLNATARGALVAAMLEG
jgi:hypothetical protein